MTTTIRVLMAEQDLKPHLRSFVRDAVQQWNLESSRYEIWKDLDRVRFLLWKWLAFGWRFS